jgi:hypothetical protein
MANELVQDYWLNYRPATETVRIWIRTAESNWQLVNELSVEKGVFLSDMLRNEKPVYWITGNVSLHTLAEPIGEEEN